MRRLGDFIAGDLVTLPSGAHASPFGVAMGRWRVCWAAGGARRGRLGSLRGVVWWWGDVEAGVWPCARVLPGWWCTGARGIGIQQSSGDGERRPQGRTEEAGGRGPLAATVVYLRDGPQRTAVSAGGVWWLVANQCRRCLCSAMNETDASSDVARLNGSKIFYVLSCFVPLNKTLFPVFLCSVSDE